VNAPGKKKEKGRRKFVRYPATPLAGLPRKVDGFYYLEGRKRAHEEQVS